MGAAGGAAGAPQVGEGGLGEGQEWPGGRAGGAGRAC